MSASVRTGADWARIIAEAYASDARPPMTEELVLRVADEVADALGAEASEVSAPDRVDRVNKALDAFEADLRAVVGPRLESVDEAAGAACMKHRSEAGQPLRAFGGQ